MTLADAIEAHDAALVFGGRAGISSLDLIESALGRPYSGYHRSIEKKAAALLESMVGNHGFVDGNKRTSLILVNILVERSGYFLYLSSDEQLDDVIVDVAKGDLGYDALVDWFRDHLIKLDKPQ